MSSPGRPPGTFGNLLHAPEDPDTLALMRSAITEDGLTPPSAAEAIGIPKSTFYDWMGASPVFAETVKAASAQLKRKLARYVMSAAPTQWQAAMTTLERLWPEEYGRRDRVSHEHAGHVGLSLEPSRMDSESVLLAAELEERLSQAEVPSLPPHEDD